MKALRNEVSKARYDVGEAQRKLDELQKKLLINLEFEKAGEELPYDYAEIHKEAETARAEIKGAPERLSDKAADFAKDLFPSLSEKGHLVKAGTRINWNGKLKRAAVDLWDTAENNPDNNPSLWEDIEFKNGYRFIPETITAGTAFSLGELGWWKGVLYKSLIDANVWNPEQHQAGWEVVSDV